MMLSQDETYEFIHRFPKIELSYETIPHKKVSPYYNICLAIPQGKKGFLWFTYDKSDDVCFFMDMNREKKISKMRKIDFEFDRTLCLGTVFYGSMIEIDGKLPIYMIEDIFFYKGVITKNLFLGEKLGFLEKIFEEDFPDFSKTKTEISICLPPLWTVSETKDYECSFSIPTKWKTKLTCFQIHHIQYRCLYEVGPYMNVFNQNSFINGAPKNSSTQNIDKPFTTVPNIRIDFSKPQYKYPAVFLVSADLQYDVYHLFAYGRKSESVYYNIAYIPNYTSSVFMNKIFRKIKENENLDAIEESDDEEEFENTSEDKYVDLQKTVAMECTFSQKFKKWVPRKIVQGQKIVHISQLANHY
jgi:hypothetical protein